MRDIFIILVCLGLGMALGFRLRGARTFLRAADRAALYAVHGLLFVLGARLGADSALLARLPSIGGKALGISLCCTAGSVLFLMPARRFFPSGRENAAPKGGGGASPFRGCLRIALVFLLGIIFAYFSVVPRWAGRSDLATHTLYLLVFAVGIGLGSDLGAFRIVRDMRAGILAAPLLIVGGALAGSLAAGLALPGVSAREALIVGAGLGYYSLSSILIENAGDSTLASVALLANIMREVMALLGAPLLVRFCGAITPVGAAGATAMDTALPVIARFSGERIAVIAVLSGMILTLLTPFLVSAALLL